MDSSLSKIKFWCLKYTRQLFKKRKYVFQILHMAFESEEKFNIHSDLKITL